VVNSSASVQVKATKSGWSVSKVKSDKASKRASSGKERTAKLSKSEQVAARADERKRVKGVETKDRRSTNKADAANYYTTANVKGRRKKKQPK